MCPCGNYYISYRFVEVTDRCRITRKIFRELSIMEYTLCPPDNWDEFEDMVRDYDEWYFSDDFLNDMVRGDRISTE